MIYNVYLAHNKQINKYIARISVKTESPDQVAEICRDGYLMCPADQREPFIDLYHIGTFDDKTGVITPIEKTLVCSNSVFELEAKGEKKDV